MLSFKLHLFFFEENLNSIWRTEEELRLSLASSLSWPDFWGMMGWTSWCLLSHCTFFLLRHDNPDLPNYIMATVPARYTITIIIHEIQWPLHNLWCIKTMGGRHITNDICNYYKNVMMRPLNHSCDDRHMFSWPCLSTFFITREAMIGICSQ